MTEVARITVAACDLCPFSYEDREMLPDDAVPDEDGAFPAFVRCSRDSIAEHVNGRFGYVAQVGRLIGEAGTETCGSVPAWCPLRVQPVLVEVAP